VVECSIVTTRRGYRGVKVGRRIVAWVVRRSPRARGYTWWLRGDEEGRWPVAPTEQAAAEQAAAEWHRRRALWAALSPIRRAFLRSAASCDVAIVPYGAALQFATLGLVADVGRELQPEGTCTCCVTPDGRALVRWAERMVIRARPE
jgi:hypothetical protein